MYSLHTFPCSCIFLSLSSDSSLCSCASKIALVCNIKVVYYRMLKINFDLIDLPVVLIILRSYYFLCFFSSSCQEINTRLKKVLHSISCINHAEVFNLFQILPVTFHIYIFTFVPFSRK